MNKELSEIIKNKILILDGSMGVMIQHLNLSEEQFRGERFKHHSVPLKGNNDILNLTSPELIASIHRQYLEAGADIIETNTFNSNELSQHEYFTESLIRELNIAGAQIARKEADRFSTPERPRFVAGSIGPTGVAASLPADINNPASRAVNFDELSHAFEIQANALIEGGVDMLLLETVFDALNLKAAIHGVRKSISNHNREIPLLLSVTVSDSSGCILSGHTPEALLAIVRHAKPFAFGFNCSAGPSGLEHYVRRLAEISPYPVIFYPNAGLPDSTGHYSEDPERFLNAIRPLLQDGILNIVGGCCGTTPEHISRLAESISSDIYPHKVPNEDKTPWLAGLDPFDDNNGFINIGERCNVAGSRKFLRLIKEKSYDEVLAIARKQVEDGAMILDINLDDGMLDTVSEMKHFLRLMASDPVVSSRPWMIDSSDFNVIEAALKEISGRAIVNSISLRKGTDEFLRQAAIVKHHGAAVVVMAFDEEGQATTYERKIEICERAYHLLIEQAGFEPRDIIFDPNILTVATGMPEHDRYAIDFIRAVQWISGNLPEVKTSGGISNLSFAFRGNNYLRQAMHAVFLYHAIRNGLSMAIMDPASKVTYESIPEDLLQLLEEVILYSRKDAAERLIEKAAEFSDDGSTASNPLIAVRPESVDERICQDLVGGDDSNLNADVMEALEHYGSASAIIEGPLMAGMEKVGQLFGSGCMFLPQVVKSAAVMHRAVDILQPYIDASATKDGSAKSRGKFLLATVRGDVHDIGKNIAATVLRCNNFEVVDLGVQVDAPTIVRETKLHNPDFIGLSGLISPSLGEMTATVAALHSAGIRVPVIVGGAATSVEHTALFIAPAYPDSIVVRVSDASQNPVIATRLLSDYNNERRKILRNQEEMRRQASLGVKKPIEPTTTSRYITKNVSPTPSFYGVRTLDPVGIDKVRPFINWKYFINCWKTDPESDAASNLLRQAEKLLDRLEQQKATMLCRVGFYNACSIDNGAAIAIGDEVITTPRQRPLPHRKGPLLSLADFIANSQAIEEAPDTIGCFIVTVSEDIRKAIAAAQKSGDPFELLLLQSVCDRLAEATSEWLHYKVRTELWGYAAGEVMDTDAIMHGRYQGIRPAVGYPSLPDQKVMFQLAKLIGPAAVGVEVTVNGALNPASSVTGFYISNPDARYFSV